MANDFGFTILCFTTVDWLQVTEATKRWGTVLSTGTLVHLDFVVTILIIQNNLDTYNCIS